MPLRVFSRNSPKTAVSDSADASSRDISRGPLLPLQEVSWNSLTSDGKTDLLNTPRTVVKWLSSSPLPDPPFFESQENKSNITADKNLLSLPTKSKIKPTGKDGRLKTFSTVDVESGSASLRSSSSSSGMHDDVFSKYPSAEQRSLNATPCRTTLEIESATHGEMQVARSLRYGQSTGSGAESLSHSTVPTQNSLSSSSNFCAQSHFEIEEDPNFWKDHNVQVVIRLRPLNSAELVTQGQSRCVRQDSASAVTWTGHPESRFTFDLVACETITQEKIFKVAGLPMVDNCLLGYNSCMFAYGQTGSGKTFTMLGDLENAQHRPSMNRGMKPRVFEYLFARIIEEEDKRSSEQLKFMCKCSFLEIYNEQILDLLEPATANLQLREDARRGVYVENLAEVEVKSVQDVITLLLQGAANRKVAATNMNRESSRSHSVFTCTIESRWTSQSVKNSRFGRLHLVDLAGSERQKSSGAEGERLKEAANINKSLSTLGLVIMSLVDIANGKQRHVPYRDSKLTFLLHDSLGGNSKTTIIANISPSKCCALETLSTLKFAQRAKFIRNNAIVNEHALGDVMALRVKIQQLEVENNRLRLKIVGASSENGISSELGEFGNASNLGSSLEAWDPFREYATSSISTKQRNGLELTLKKTLHRQQTADAKIKELEAEIEQFKCLVKQREEDTQRGKMMLRFREDKIKRMEALLGGLISPDTYLTNERDSLLEEVQILRTRLERNPEVTRFAMENIRLQEELHRYQVFYEEGEHDMMEKEIALLQEQLLEALDWKLMHEEDPVIDGKAQDTVIGKRDPYDAEADPSNLEKQIETVGAVASMQAELIAMQDAVAAVKSFEAEAHKRATILEKEVEVLKNIVRELQEENAKLATGMNLKDIENENAKIRCMQAAQERESLAETVKRESELMKEKHATEMEELNNCLLVAQEELQTTKRQVAAKHSEAEAHERTTTFLVAEVEVLQNSLRELQEEKAKLASEMTYKELEIENAQIRCMHEAAQERESLAAGLKRELDFMKEKHATEIMELKNCLLVAVEELEKTRSQQDAHIEELFATNSQAMDHAPIVESFPFATIHDGKSQGLDCEEVARTQNMMPNGQVEYSDIKDLQERLIQMEESNDRLSALLECAVAENEVLVKKSNEKQDEERGQSFESNQSSSKLQVESESSNVKVEQVEEGSADATEMELISIKSEVSELKEMISKIELENTKLQSVCELALLEKGHLTETLTEYQERSKQNEDELQSLRVSLSTAELELQNRREDRTKEACVYAYQQEEDTVKEITNSWSRAVVEEQCFALASLDGKFRTLLFNAEEKIKTLHETINVLMEELGHDSKSFMDQLEKLNIEVDRLLCLVDESDMENKKLSKKLEQATSMLRQAEQARSDVCCLSSAEKDAWVEEKRTLEESLDSALKLCSSKEESWHASLTAYEFKLDLVEAKLSDLSSLVDSAIARLQTECEGKQESFIQSLTEVWILQKETEHIEERYCLARVKLHQEDNKGKALSRLLAGLEDTKPNWCSRERRLQDHVKGLCRVLEEKEMEICKLKTDDENLRSSLDQHCKQEELMELEMAALREKLHSAEDWQTESSDNSCGQSAKSGFSMLQLLRGEEEKATLLSVIAEDQEKMKVIRSEIKHTKGCIDKIETALLCAHVEREAVASSLEEAEAELEEIKKEVQMLVETEAEVQKELETLAFVHLEAESGAAELMKQLDDAHCRMQILKKRFSQVEEDSLPFVAEIIYNVQQSKASVKMLLQETQTLLIDMKDPVQNR